jgi:hypothetical protein
MRDGKWEEAEDLVAKALVCGEQVAYHHGNWQVGWLLTHLPEPQFRRMGVFPDPAQLRPFSRLAQPEWTTAATQYWKDIQALNSSHKAPNPKIPWKAPEPKDPKYKKDKYKKDKKEPPAGDEPA